METRQLDQVNGKVSVVGLGTWQLGADWGTVDESEAHSILEASVEAGVTFIDTADVYGDGRSEQIIGAFLSDRDTRDDLTVATKLGRRAPQVPEEFTLTNFRNWVDRSRSNLGVDTLDLVQLHCPPTAVFSNDQVFDDMDTLVDDGRIAAYGVSVETCAEALAALDRPNVATIQIILNVFRRKPLEEVLPRAAAQGVGIIARVPLASGLLTGKFTEASTFGSDDHRNYNRHGDAFDVGETFSGVDYAKGVEASQKFAEIAGDESPAQFALRWVIQQPGVTTVIPGASSVSQAQQNADAASLAPIDDDRLQALSDLYDEYFRADVHSRW